MTDTGHRQEDPASDQGTGVRKGSRLGEVLDAYLRALEAGNPPGREALLARHPDLAEELKAALLGIDFVHGAAPHLVPNEQAREQADALPGGLLGDYRLLRELGRGGMAVVYEAEQISLARRVALKVLPFAAVLDPKQLQRFKNEAMAAAHLRHPNIVPVYGVGCERGVHYYAMQYVEGQSLATAIADMKGGKEIPADGPKTPISSHGSNREPAYIRMAAALGVQAAQALDHAHQLGIVHRDVKPGNLLADLAGTLWVTDFGLATSMKDASLTITGELLGTIRYMSPEQALAKRVPIDHRTDVYSLGATLYELLTLEPAFPGDNPHRVIQDIAFKEPVLPRRLNPTLPRDLETVLLKAMWKDPTGRYATAQEMADDLTRFLDNRPIEAKRPGLLRRAAKWSRRHRTLVGATVVLLLLSMAGLATGTALLWREQDQTEDALENAQANLDLALQALDQIYIDEAQGNPKIREGLPRDLLEKGLGFYEAFVKENAGNRGPVFLMGNACHRAGMIFRELGEEERAVESFEGALSAYDRAIEFDPRNTWAHNGRGNALLGLKRFEDALAAYDRAIEIDPRYAMVDTNRGMALNNLGRFEEALAACDRAIENDARYAPAHLFRGKTLEDLGRLEDALVAVDRALEINPQDAAAHNNRCKVLRNLGRSEQSLAACDRCLEIDPRYVAGHINRGAVLCDQLGRPGEALDAFDRAIEISPRDAMAHLNRGNALIGLKRFEDALAAYDRAIEIDSGYALAQFGRGNALGELGRSEEALVAYARAIELDQRDTLAYTNRGAVLRELGRFEEALAAWNRAIELDPRSAEAHFNRGAVLRDLGRFDAALAACDRAIELDPRDASSHVGRGNALSDLGRFEAAIEAYLEAIRLQPDDPAAHNNLGSLLRNTGDTDGAIREYRETIRLDPDEFVGHLNVGSALLDAGDIQGADASYREAIRLKPDHAESHYALGTTLDERGDPESAIEEYREAIRFRPDYAEAHCNLGHALVKQTRFSEALPWLRKGHELGSMRPGWKYPSAEWIESAERKAGLEDPRDQMISGLLQPRDALERIEFALVLYDKASHAESARMFAEAFAENAALAEDLAKGHRYSAACSAALAAAHGDADAAEWRGRSLEWLRADLAARQKAATGLAATLGRWKKDPDFASVRDRLGELPEPERAAWRELWAAVDLALAAAGSLTK